MLQHSEDGGGGESIAGPINDNVTGGAGAGAGAGAGSVQPIPPELAGAHDAATGMHAEVHWGAWSPATLKGD